MTHATTAGTIEARKALEERLERRAEEKRLYAQALREERMELVKKAAWVVGMAATAFVTCAADSLAALVLG